MVAQTQPAAITAFPSNREETQKPVLRKPNGDIAPGSGPLNPLGRPKGVRSYVASLIGDRGQGAIDVLWDIAQGKAWCPKVERNGELLEHAPILPTISERKAAANDLLDRLEGKPTAKIEHTGAEGSPLTVLSLGNLAPEALDALCQIELPREVEGERIDDPGPSPTLPEPAP